MRTIAICNQKGGVGKTTISVLLADAATRAGHRVLLVDLDPQANASAAAGATTSVTQTLGRVLTDPRGGSISRAVQRGSLGFDVARSSVELASKERNRRTADEHDLRRLLHPLSERYDLALIDSPPSLGVLTVNALTAADEYLVVTDPAKFALDGIRGVTRHRRRRPHLLQPRPRTRGSDRQPRRRDARDRPPPRTSSARSTDRSARAGDPTPRRRQGSDRPRRSLWDSAATVAPTTSATRSNSSLDQSRCAMQPDAPTTGIQPRP